MLETIVGHFIMILRTDISPRYDNWSMVEQLGH